jgi:hypothetical protein
LVVNLLSLACVTSRILSAGITVVVPGEFPWPPDLAQEKKKKLFKNSKKTMDLIRGILNCFKKAGCR